MIYAQQNTNLPTQTDSTELYLHSMFQFPKSQKHLISNTRIQQI